MPVEFRSASLNLPESDGIIHLLALYRVHHRPAKGNCTPPVNAMYSLLLDCSLVILFDFYMMLRGRLFSPGLAASSTLLVNSPFLVVFLFRFLFLFPSPCSCLSRALACAFTFANRGLDLALALALALARSLSLSLASALALALAMRSA